MLSSNESESRCCGLVSFIEDIKIYINILVLELILILLIFLFKLAIFIFFPWKYDNMNNIFSSCFTAFKNYFTMTYSSIQASPLLKQFFDSLKNFSFPLDKNEKIMIWTVKQMKWMKLLQMKDNLTSWLKNKNKNKKSELNSNCTLIWPAM